MNAEEKKSRIPALDVLERVYRHPGAQEGLVQLYKTSQAECMRNNVCGMEIGMAREKDQGAVFKMFLGDSCNLEVDNTLPEDFLILGEGVSSKHSSSKIGTPVKVKWSDDETTVKQDIHTILTTKDSHPPHLLLTYLDSKANLITVICISSDHHHHTLITLGKDAFHLPKGNSRGIEFSRKAMELLLSKPYFTVVISSANLNGGISPIERRLRFLREIGVNGF
jgi:hypothetical protein